jgi:Vacuolar protein sorting-associated protein 62
VAGEDLLRRFSPYLQYDSLESYRSDSAAIMPEQFFDDGSKWGYTNTLKRKGGSVLAAARPKPGQEKLDLAFLSSHYSRDRKALPTDFLDAAGRRYVEDARRLHADPRYADRVYGHMVDEPNGPTWLQYWFFYYYNDKNFFGVGLHEGDWEMIQLRVGRDGTPNAATFAQHRDGEAFNWSDLKLRDSPEGPVPVVYVGRGSHASFAGPGEHWPMFPLPPDYSDGKGPLIRPTLEVASDETSAWLKWPGKWGSSDSSPTGPAEKGQWRNPTAFHLELGGVTRGRVRKRPRPAPDVPAPPAPKVTLTRVEDQVVVRYEFPQRLPAGTARPERLVVSVDTLDDDLPPASHAVTVRTRSGVFAHPMRLEEGRGYVVRTVAYSEDGVQSTLVTTSLPPPRARRGRR